MAFILYFRSILPKSTKIAMSAKNTASDHKIYLETFKDWRIWDKTFQLRANAAGLWDLVDPKGSQQPMQAPVKPLISSYNRRIPPQLIEPDLPRHTRQSDSQGSQTITPTYTLETTDPIERAQSIRDLTAEDKTSYQSSRRDYDQDYKEYQRQQEQINSLKKWMIDTVAIGLMDSAFFPQQDLRNWYINLEDSVGASQTQQRNEARIKYQTALAAVPKTLKDFPRWLTDWEQATHQALTLGIGGLDDPNVWFEDLSKVIQPAVGHWVTTYRGIYRKELESRSLPIREVAKALREEAAQYGLQQPAKAPRAPGRITRGTFGPTYDEEPDQANQPDQGQDPDKEGQQAGSSGSAGPFRPKRNRKRKSDQSGPEAKKTKSKDDRDQNDSPICEACGGRWHTWLKCYYVFPSKAPAGFEFRPLIQDAVTYRLSCQEWKDKLKALKGASGPVKSD